MNEITQVIKTLKESVTTEEWQKRIIECQNSGLTVTAWCKQNTIAPSTYYRYLRKNREHIIEQTQVVKLPKYDTPYDVESEIRITTEKIDITLPVNAKPEQLSAILNALRTC